MDEIEIASGAAAITRLRPEWKRVAPRADGAAAFEAFFLAVEAAKAAEGRGAEPLVAVVHRDGVASSFIALRKERLLGARVAVPLLYPLAQYTDVSGQPLTPDELLRLCKALRHKGTDVLLLRKVRQDSGLFEALSQHGQSQRAEDLAYYIDLEAYGSFAKYDASFSARTRRNRRQRMQKLEQQAGPLSFEVLRGEHGAQAFDIAMKWKRRWLAQRGIFSPVFDGGVWEHLLRSAVSTGSVIVTALKAGAEPVAIEVGLKDRSDYIAYLGAYDERFGQHSPGQEQMLRTIEWCFEQGFRRYDLLAPADDYKRHWARGETHVGVDDYAIPLTHIGRGISELRRHVRPLARDVYHRLSPDVRIAGGKYGMPAAAVAAVAAASAVIATIE
jgi:CelD/BcsL family acetyltransferase involved in cellulose biosynthesis